MANYGIMRIEKRGRSAVYGLQLEANRDKNEQRDFAASDINWDKTDDNIFLIKTENWNQEITRQINQSGCKEKKDSIVLLDALFTASPEYFQTLPEEEMKKYFNECLDFYVKNFCGGDKSLVINAVIHLDEKTPHMAIASVPLIQDEKGAHLSAKIVMGGKYDYRKRQNLFYDEIGKPRGFDRGTLHDAEHKREHLTSLEYKIAQSEKVFDELEQSKITLEKTNEKIKELNQKIDELENIQPKEAAKAKIIEMVQQIYQEFGYVSPFPQPDKVIPEKKDFRGNVKEKEKMVIDSDIVRGLYNKSVIYEDIMKIVRRLEVLDKQITNQIDADPRIKSLEEAINNERSERIRAQQQTRNISAERNNAEQQAAAALDFIRRNGLMEEFQYEQMQQQTRHHHR